MSNRQLSRSILHSTINRDGNRRYLPLSLLAAGLLFASMTGCHHKMTNDEDASTQTALRYNAQQTDSALNLDAAINGKKDGKSAQANSKNPMLDPEEQASIDHLADDQARLEAFQARQQANQSHPGVSEPPSSPVQPSLINNAPDSSNGQSSAIDQHKAPAVGPKVVWAQDDPDYARLHADDPKADNDKPKDDKNAATDAKPGDDKTASTAGKTDKDAGSNDQADVSHALKPNTDGAIVALNAQLHRDVVDSKSPLQQYMAMASLAVLDGKQQVDPSSIYDLSDGEKKLLGEYQDAQVALGQRFAAGSAGKDSVINAIDDLSAKLSADQLLGITDFKLCSSVQNFGMYDEIPTTSFIAGEPSRMIVYTEIQHFNSVPSTDGKYITRLHHEVELYTEKDGQCVYKWGSVPVVDYCRKVRKDFFIPRQIALPTNLTMGKYRLKVRITDDSTQAQAESVIPISVVAAGDLEAHK